MTLLLLLVSAMATLAQSAPPATITVEQAIDEALARNLSLLADRYNVSIADAQLIQARLRPNPVVSLGLDYLDILGTGFNPATNGAGPAEGNSRVDFIVERGRKRQNRIAVAEANKSIAELELQNSMRSLVLDVQSAFVDALLAKENITLAQESLRAFNEIVRINTARVRTGDLSRVELVRSEVAALQFQNQVRQSQLQLRLARNRLQTLLGRTAWQDAFDVKGEMRREGTVLLLPELQAQALELRPDIQVLTRTQARSQYEIRLQLAQGRADFTLGTQFHRQFGVANGSSLGFFFSAPLPIFNRNQGEIARVQREREQIEARIRALRAEVNAEVQNAFQQYETARQLVASIETDMMERARRVRQVIEFSYKRGEATFVELLDAQRTFNETMQGYNEARAEYARTLYTIDAITGNRMGGVRPPGAAQPGVTQP